MKAILPISKSHFASFPASGQMMCGSSSLLSCCKGNSCFAPEVSNFLMESGSGSCNHKLNMSCHLSDPSLGCDPYASTPRTTMQITAARQKQLLFYIFDSLVSASHCLQISTAIQHAMLVCDCSSVRTACIHTYKNVLQQAELWVHHLTNQHLLQSVMSDESRSWICPQIFTSNTGCANAQGVPLSLSLCAALEHMNLHASVNTCQVQQQHCYPHAFHVLTSGGAKVLDGIGSALRLQEGYLTASRAVLHDYGNISSSSTW